MSEHSAGASGTTPPLHPRDVGIGRLFDRVRDAVIVADANSGRIVLWNRAAETLFGYSASEALGLLVEVLVPERLREQHRAGLARYRETGHGAAIDASVPLELPAVRKTGHELTIEMTLSRVDEATVEGCYVLAIIRDLTERKRAEEERMARSRDQAARAEAEVAQQRQAFLAQASALLAASLDYEATLASVARLVVPQLADWCAVDMVGEDGALRPLAVAHVDPAKVELARELQAHYPADPNTPYGAANVVRTGRPELYPELPDWVLVAAARDAEHLRLLRELGLCSAMCVPLSARGRTLGAITLVATESERRYGAADLALAEDLAGRAAIAVDNARLYREAQEALRARDEFLSVAAHELKTPVTSVRGFAQGTLRQLDREGTLDAARLRRALEVIDQQTDKLARLLSQLLDISRIEAGQLALERAVTDVTPVVESAAAMARAQSSRHPIVVRTPGEVPALVDPLRLEQVLTNLLDNAIKYSAPGAQIDVDVSTPDSGTVRLAVRDRGMGIPADHQQRIFDRYYQVHKSKELAGMGLGLYVSRQIVELHGGHMAVESPADGGACFVVTLPRGLP